MIFFLYRRLGDMDTCIYNLESFENHQQLLGFYVGHHKYGNKFTGYVFDNMCFMQFLVKEAWTFKPVPVFCRGRVTVYSMAKQEGL
jgi:hypothetical protein